MKIKIVLAALLLTILEASCSTTGEYLPLSNGETGIGTVQSTFTVQQ